MLTTTAAKIIAQLPALCEKLKIPEEYRRDGYFYSKEVAKTFNWTRETDVLLSVGEVHMGCQYLLTFDVGGTLVALHKVEWDAYADSHYHRMEVP